MAAAMNWHVPKIEKFFLNLRYKKKEYNVTLYGNSVKVQVGGDAGFSLWWSVKATKSLSAFFKLVYFSFSSGGWLAKCLVPAVAKFSLSPACAVTFIRLRGCCDVS